MPHTGSSPSSAIAKQTLGQVDPLYAALDNAAAAQDDFVERMYAPAAASSAAAQGQPAAAPAQQQSLPQPCATSSIEVTLISDPSQQQQHTLPEAVNSQEGEQPDCLFLSYEPEELTAAELAIYQELLELHGGVLPQQQSVQAGEEEVVTVAVSELDRIQEQMDSLQGQFESMQEKNLQLSASNDTVLTQLSAANSKLAGQKALNLQLEGMNSNLQASLEQVETRFKSTTVRLYDKVSQVQQLQESNAQLQQTTTLQQSSITHLQQESQQQQQTIGEQQQSMAQLQETSQQQEAQLAAERASRREAEADRQQLCDELAAEQKARLRAEAHSKKLQELLVSHAEPFLCQGLVHALCDVCPDAGPDCHHACTL
jgi:DNA repair exonuclease SbcCD ATPase subunit